MAYPMLPLATLSRIAGPCPLANTPYPRDAPSRSEARFAALRNIADGAKVRDRLRCCVALA